MSDSDCIGAVSELQAQVPLLDPQPSHRPVTTSGVLDPEDLRPDPWYMEMEWFPAIPRGEGRPQGKGPTEESAANLAAPVPGITGVSSSQEPEKWEVSGGVDGLEATIFGTHDASFGETEKLLEAGRQAAVSGGHRNTVEVEGATLFMKPRGHRWGNTFFPWVGEYDGIKYSLRPACGSIKTAVAKVEFASLKLMREGHRSCWLQARTVLEGLGIRITDTLLFRVDVCVDLAGVGVAPYVEAVFNQETIQRIRSGAHCYKNPDGTWQGCSVGNRKGVLVNIYDKLVELGGKIGEQRVAAEAKKAIMVQRRWGFLPEKATRVEFQIRGDWIRSRWPGCRSVDQLFDALDSIVGYLVHGFFRIVDGAVDRDNKNQKRAEVSPLWQTVIDGFMQWVEHKGVELERARKTMPEASFEKACESLVRSALSVAAFTPGYVVDRSTCVEQVCAILMDKLPRGSGVLEKLQATWNKWQAQGVSGVFTFEDCGVRHPWHNDPLPGSSAITQEELGILYGDVFRPRDSEELDY